jgi:hypothetical protein
VHYTSAEAAASIIEKKELWMRNTTCMVDFREVEHGISLLERLLHPDHQLGLRKALCDATDKCHEGAAEDAIKLAGHHLQNIRYRTYITCLSEFDENEDLRGKLSMWRAFNRGTPTVALVFSLPRYMKITTTLGLQFSAVAYFDEDAAAKVLQKVITNIQHDTEWLKSQHRDLVTVMLIAMILNGVASLKDSAFKEEKEWRAIYFPDFPRETSLQSDIKCINGAPQRIYKIPLNGTKGVEELALHRLFDRLIIGPSQYPAALADAFVQLLTDAKVQNAAQRVHVAGIPIRP